MELISISLNKKDFKYVCLDIKEISNRLKYIFFYHIVKSLRKFYDMFFAIYCSAMFNKVVCWK